MQAKLHCRQVGRVTTLSSKRLCTGQSLAQEAHGLLGTRNLDLECRARFHLEPICNFRLIASMRITRHGQENLSNTLSKVSHIRWAHFDTLPILAISAEAISAEGTLARGEDQTDGGSGAG